LSNFDGLGRSEETDALLTASGSGNGTFIGADVFGGKQAIPGGYLDLTQAGDGIISTYQAWDDDSQLIASRDDNGATSGFIHDNQGRQLVGRDGLFDNGTGISIVGGDSGSFDSTLEGGDPIDDTEVNGTDTTDTFDADGHVTGETEQAGNSITCTFDAL